MTRQASSRGGIGAGWAWRTSKREHSSPPSPSRPSRTASWPNGLHNHDHWWHFSERTLRTWFENLGLTNIGFANTIRDYEDDKLMDYHIVAVKPV